ncbi:hypothetical protein E8E12_008847 [Didymella heteroderae]|uniref:Glycoside hydrolase family 28 protein n=1 Tax=Didymella heteroderae TaxID=1769908 RepID=A0A9P5C2C8_9PLEO|nr:hypothetical protein E8E12_008847 [Didymella heteroderae]
MRIVQLLPATLLIVQSSASPAQNRKTCTIKSSGTNKTDDAPAIRTAFKECGRHGKVIFEPTTYYVNSVLSITDLEDVDIDVQGELLYWLNASLPVGYQNQSTAFVLGGNNVRIDGHGVGTLNGNGDYWYQWIKKQSNTSNYPGRPHQITFNGLTNSIVKGLRFLRSQMWTMSIIHSYDSAWQDIFINNTGNVVSSSNTDGADTFFSSNLLFKNWTVYNGDDSFSAKANSTNITLLDSHFYHGLGIAIGSIGQYDQQFETVENFRAENIYFEDTLHAFYAKTWTDDRVGFPPNGGGGGLGFAENMRLKNLTKHLPRELRDIIFGYLLLEDGVHARLFHYYNTLDPKAPRHYWNKDFTGDATLRELTESWYRSVRFDFDRSLDFLPHLLAQVDTTLRCRRQEMIGKASFKILQCDLDLWPAADASGIPSPRSLLLKNMECLFLLRPGAKITVILESPLPWFSESKNLQKRQAQFLARVLDIVFPTLIRLHQAGYSLAVCIDPGSNVRFLDGQQIWQYELKNPITPYNAHFSREGFVDRFLKDDGRKLRYRSVPRVAG